MLTKKCIVCGKEFIKPVNESLKAWNIRHKFCSISCKSKFTYYKNGKLVTYQFSKERHYIPPTAFKKGERHYIKTEFKKGSIPWNKNIKADKEWYKKMKDAGFLTPKWGEKSGNWKGGITKLGASIRTMTMYKKWRTACFVRDGYTCQKCGGKTTKGKKVYLQCHHLNPFYKILIDNNIKSIDDAKKCNKLWDINNGQTLCILCHKQTDSYLKNQYTL